MKPRLRLFSAILGGEADLEVERYGYDKAQSSVYLRRIIFSRLSGKSALFF